MKVVALSDVHSKLGKVKLPDADLLVISGDLTIGGSIKEYSQLNHACGDIKHKFKYGILLCEGNHDFLGEKQPSLADSLIHHAKLVRHNAITINGIKFFITPYNKWYFNWAFNIWPGEQSQKIWAQIPNDTEVLVSHGPPYETLDCPPNKEHVGDVDLWNRIQLLHKLKLHIFGHIHHSAGFEQRDKVWYVNASTCNESCQPINPPIIIEIDDSTHEVLKVYKYTE